MGIKKWLTMFLPSLLLTATGVNAAEIHGTSSTQFQWFENIFKDDKTQVELGEYLRLNIDKIDPAGKFSVYGYGRGSQDFTTGEGLNGRLYYLYGEYRDLFNRADVRVGRQFVNLAAGSAIIDGGQVNIKNIGPVGVTVMGGHDVVYGLNGEIGGGNRAAMGVAAYLAGFKRTDAEISWFRRTDTADVTRDVIGGMFKQYLFDNIKVYGNARYDLVSESFNELQGGLKFFPMSNLVFTGEYYQSYPTFDTTSIYSVFAVDQYRESVFRVDYTINNMISVSGGYNHEWFGEGAQSDVWLAGLSLRPIDALRINAEYDDRYGYYGSTSGVMVDVIYDLKALELAAGFDYDVYQRDVLTGDEIARKYWIGGKYRINKALAISGRLQDDVNVRYTSNFSGRVVLDYNF